MHYVTYKKEHTWTLPLRVIFTDAIGFYLVAMETVSRCDMFSKYFLLVIGKDWFSSISGNNYSHFHEKITNNSVVCISTNLQPNICRS